MRSCALVEAALNRRGSATETTIVPTAQTKPAVVGPMLDR